AYDAELDEAVHRVVARDGHRRLVLSAHSTGGLVVPLWADRRRRSGDPVLRRVLGGLVLNSPWFDMQGAWWMRSLGTAVVDQVGRRRPRLEVPRTVTGVYARSLHRDHDGEWDFDLAWKPIESFAVHAGWLRAIRHGHARLQRGLDVPAPVLVLSSDRSAFPREMVEDVHETDVVLEVPQIRRWATAIGSRVTYVAVAGARHDVVLSRQPAREQVYRELERWWAAYVDDPTA
ncbi:MAG: alpha/beta hydrolase, partial [Nocardioides sp.]